MATRGSPQRHRNPWHAPEKGSGPAFALSLLAHAALFIAIAFVVRWKSEPVGTVSAELWSLPPPAVQQPAPTPPPRPVKIEPPTPYPLLRKADIVIEQKKAPPPKAEVKNVAPPVPPKKDVPKKADVKSALIDKPPDSQSAVQYALRQAGTPGAATTASSAGLSDAYKALLQGCIRPHIIFNVPEGTRPRQYQAEFEVTLLPTGEQAGAPKLLRASGLTAYDQAVDRAIRRCDPFPRPKDGPMPRSIPLIFDPVER